MNDLPIKNSVNPHLLTESAMRLNQFFPQTSAVVGLYSHKVAYQEHLFHMRYLSPRIIKLNHIIPRATTFKARGIKQKRVV